MLEVPLQECATWGKKSNKYLAPVVSKHWHAMKKEVMHDMNTQFSVDLQEDEQHSRPQRNGSLGHAPYVTVMTIWGAKKLICSIEHIDRASQQLSSAAACALGRAQSFSYIAQNLIAILVSIITDACTSAGTSVDMYLQVIWTLLQHSHDLWHKTRHWSVGLADFCSQTISSFW